MPRDFSVSEERSIAATPSAVWAVISDPARHERLDPRVRLVSRTGEDGQVGSGYVLTLRYWIVMRIRIRYVIVDADTESRLVAHMSRDDRRVIEQHADLVADPAGSRLRWTMVSPLGPFSRWVARRTAPRELTTWLDAVEREACGL